MRSRTVSFVAPLAWLVAAVVGAYLNAITFDGPTWLTRALLVAAVAGFIGVFCVQLWRWAVSGIAVTDRRVLERGGLFGRKIRELPLAGVGEIDFRQTILQRVRDTGRIVLWADSARGGRMVLHVRDAEHTHRLVCDKVLDARARRVAQPA